MVRSKHNSQTKDCLDQAGTVTRQPWLLLGQQIVPHKHPIHPSIMQQMRPPTQGTQPPSQRMQHFMEQMQHSKQQIQPPTHQIQPAIQQFQLPVNQLLPPMQEMLPHMRIISETQYDDNPLKVQGSLTNIPMHVRFQDER